MPKKVLVIDDDSGLQDIFRLILEHAGYKVDIYANANIILAHEYSIPDVFLVDKQLSGTDGLDVCRFLKRQQATAHIPVIMVSANPDIKTLSLKAGADDYIEKPFDMTYLVEMVKKYAHAS